MKCGLDEVLSWYLKSKLPGIRVDIGNLSTTGGIGVETESKKIQEEVNIALGKGQIVELVTSECRSYGSYDSGDEKYKNSLTVEWIDSGEIDVLGEIGRRTRLTITGVSCDGYVVMCEGKRGIVSFESLDGVDYNFLTIGIK